MPPSDSASIAVPAGLSGELSASSRAPRSASASRARVGRKSVDASHGIATPSASATITYESLFHDGAG